MKNLIFAALLMSSLKVTAATLNNNEIIDIVTDAIFEGGQLKHGQTGKLTINGRPAGTCTLWKHQDDNHFGHVFGIDKDDLVNEGQTKAYSTIWARKTALTGTLNKRGTQVQLEVAIKNPGSSLQSELLRIQRNGKHVVLEITHVFMNGSQRSVKCNIP